jgi:hypothetical protein
LCRWTSKRASSGSNLGTHRDYDRIDVRSVRNG